MTPPDSPPIKSTQRLRRRLMGAPTLVRAIMPSEIIPQGLVSLELELNGWGWLQLESLEDPQPQIWFWQSQVLTLFVPVGSRPILKLHNIWGSCRYQIDAIALRTEVWLPHESSFRFDLPNSAKLSLPEQKTILPSHLWRTAEVNVSMVGHWHVPDLKPQGLSPPSFSGTSLPKWSAAVPLQDLDQRLLHNRIVD